MGLWSKPYLISSISLAKIFIMVKKNTNDKKESSIWIEVNFYLFQNRRYKLSVVNSKKKYLKYIKFQETILLIFQKNLIEIKYYQRN